LYELRRWAPKLFSQFNQFSQFGQFSQVAVNPLAR
jgi:hypothetical protein